VDRGREWNRAGRHGPPLSDTQDRAHTQPETEYLVGNRAAPTWKTREARGRGQEFSQFSPAGRYAPIKRFVAINSAEFREKSLAPRMPTSRFSPYRNSIFGT